MKRYYVFIIIFLSVFSFASCAVGSGCPADKANSVKFNRKGQFKSNSKGKTKLFPGKLKR